MIKIETMLCAFKYNALKGMVSVRKYVLLDISNAIKLSIAEYGYFDTS